RTAFIALRPLPLTCCAKIVYGMFKMCKPLTPRVRALSLTRRVLLRTDAALGGWTAAPAPAHAAGPAVPDTAAPLPLGDVRLTPSPWRDALDANLKYL